MKTLYDVNYEPELVRHKVEIVIHGGKKFWLHEYRCTCGNLIKRTTRNRKIRNCLKCRAWAITYNPKNVTAVAKLTGVCYETLRGWIAKDGFNNGNYYEGIFGR